MNNGERAELLAKIYLIYLRDNRLAIPGIGQITSVGFNGREYSPLNNILSIIETYDNDTLKSYGETLGITKAPASAKADVYINGIGYSLKFSGSALPALINHTHRSLILRVCNRIGLPITNLDNAIEEYWRLRLNREINEDIEIVDNKSPFRHTAIKNDLKELLKYFLFTGTGTKNSNNPASYLIEFSEYFNMNTWNILTPDQAIQSYINGLVISIRSKGMPSTYSPTSESTRDEEISIWTRYTDNKYKGCLHIRG